MTIPKKIILLMTMEIKPKAPIDSLNYVPCVILSVDVLENALFSYWSFVYSGMLLNSGTFCITNKKCLLLLEF